MKPLRDQSGREIAPGDILDMRWRNMRDETPPRSSQAVLAINNQGAALVWCDPSQGATWVVQHLPGRGETISDTLGQFHSWCDINEWHRHANMLINPAYYGQAPMPTLEQHNEQSRLAREAANPRPGAGVLCDCGAEMVVTHPGQTNMGSPPSVSVHCPKCSATGQKY